MAHNTPLQSERSLLRRVQLRARGAGPWDVLLILPPDFYAPDEQKRHRFPPQGPALVAAALAPDGISVRAIDLEHSVNERQPVSDPSVLDRDELVAAHLRGDTQPPIEALLDDLLARIDFEGCDAVALSMDRHTQIPIASLIAAEVKRRRGKRTIIGGITAYDCLQFLEQIGALGVDVVTTASSPAEIREAFRALREMGGERLEPAREVVHHEIPVDLDEWPTPDFSIYDLDLYRRDPFATEQQRLPSYDGAAGAILVLPYHFTSDCQYKCTFCQRGGTQTAKSMVRVVADLETLRERFGAREFVMFDAQINLLAIDLARALIDAKLDVRWSDSFRVRPRHSGDLEVMAQSGFAAMTIGVESASEKMLKRMIKGHRSKDATRLVREAHQLEIMTRVNLLTCFPHETREDFLETRDWLAENAFAIDDLAPSSFYLAAGSPVGQAPEKFGIRVRGVRTEEGDYRFRKNRRSLAYDEIDGLTWEQRQPLLRQTEDELRDVWRSARAGVGWDTGVRPTMMLGLRRHVPTKREAYEVLRRWSEGARPPGDGAQPVVDVGPPRLPRIVSPQSPGGELADRFEAAMAEAIPELTRMLGRNLAGHMILFHDDDFLCFRGEVALSTDAQPAPVSMFIETMLAYRFREASRRRLYGRLIPGAAVMVSESGLLFPADPGATEPLRHGHDFHVLSFLPAPA